MPTAKRPAKIPIGRRRLSCSTCGKLDTTIVIYEGDVFVEEKAEIDHFLSKECTGRVTLSETVPLFHLPPVPSSPKARLVK